jgi:hypothetical protein
MKARANPTSIQLESWFLCLLLCLTLLAPARLLAQDQLVVPDNFENAEGTHRLLSPFSAAPLTHQLLIHEDQLTEFVGKPILGLEMRLDGDEGSDWPEVDVVFDNYDVYLSEGVLPADRSTVFADNVIGPQTQVRSGSMTIPAGAFPSGASPNEFGYLVEFDAWPYTGGHLLVELRHTGHLHNAPWIDAVGSSDPGYRDQFASVWVTGYDATVGLQANFPVTRLTARTGLVVEPESI